MPRRVVVQPVKEDGPARMRLDRVDDAWIALARLGAQAHRERKVQLVEEIEEPPHADAVAVIPPRPVGHLRVVHEERLDGRAGLAPHEVLDGQHGPHGHARAVGPAERRTIDDGGIGRWNHATARGIPGGTAPCRAHDAGIRSSPSRTGTTLPPTRMVSIRSPVMASLMCTKLCRRIFVPCSLTILTSSAAFTRPWRTRYAPRGPLAEPVAGSSGTPEVCGANMRE